MRPTTLLVALLLLGAGFVYGFLSAREKLFPYPVLASLFGEGGGAGTEAPRNPGEGPMDTGWWVKTGRPTEEEVTSALDDLGYSQTYQGAEDEAFGVVLFEEDRALPGLNLVVSAHAPVVILADMEGNPLHEWSFAFDDVPRPEGWEPPGTFGMRYFRRAALLEDGGLLAIYDRTGVVSLDRDSNLRWSRVGGYHHDLAVTEDGTIWTLRHDVHVVPRIHPSVEVFEDFVVALDPAGNTLREYSLLEALEDSPWASLLSNLDPEEHPDLFHTNSIEVLDGSLADRSPAFAAGNVLVSIWGLDTVCIVDLDGGTGGGPSVAWALTGLWHRQHEPQLLANGNLLVFDNMGHGGMSKVVELDPLRQEIAWSYEGDEENGFYSALCGSSQRLANGNTLITESLSGRAFEVDAAGEVVWRYLSPFRVHLEETGEEGVAVLMEVVRLPADAAPWLRAR